MLQLKYIKCYKVGIWALIPTPQSGVKTFKIANLKTDAKIMLQAKSDSESYINSGEYKNNMSFYKIIKDLDRLN